jgi:hypothetical protein
MSVPRVLIFNEALLPDADFVVSSSSGQTSEYNKLWRKCKRSESQSKTDIFRELIIISGGFTNSTVGGLEAAAASPTVAPQ